MKVKVWTVERPTQPTEAGKVLVDDLKMVKSEADTEVRLRRQVEPDAGWTSVEIEVDVPVARP